MKCGKRIKFFDNGLYISALEHVIKLISFICVLLIFLNRIRKHQYIRLIDSAQFMRSVNSWAWAISLTPASLLI